jgi:hypothetical protein
MDSQRAWSICHDYFENSLHGELVAGRAENSAQSYVQQGLSFDANGRPYVEHADVVGWHEESGLEYDALKSFWKDACRELAKQSRFVRRPN